MTEHELYHGQRFVGHVRDRRGKWEAYAADFTALGAFPSKEKAERAVLDSIMEREAGR